MLNPLLQRHPDLVPMASLAIIWDFRMRIQVDCYAGYRGEETPRRIRMATYKIEVKKVLDRWLATDHRYFKVIGDDDATYIIRHDTVKWEWELVFYRSVEGVIGSDNEFGES